MNPGLRMPDAVPSARREWILPVAAGLSVALLQFWFVAVTGTGVPVDDQWEVEGAQLYPLFSEGMLRFADLWRAHNEHRILWTKLADTVLFSVNGQWDPLVQLFAIIGLRAVVAGGLAAALAKRAEEGMRLATCLVVAWLFLPHLAWHNVIWGFQSHVYFSLGFSLLAFWFFADGPLTPPRWAAGVACGAAAQLGMAAGAFVPVALFALVILRLAGLRSRAAGLTAGEAASNAAPAGGLGICGDWGRPMTTLLWLGLGAILLGGMAALLGAGVPGNEALRAKTAGAFLKAFGLGLAWPYPGNPWVGLAACLPFGLVVVLRLTGRRKPAAGEDYVLLMGFFALAAAIAQAAMRGGGDEFAERVPSRYAEFFVPWVLANCWCVWSVCAAAAPGRKFLIRVGGAAWLVLLLSGWLAATAETWRGIVLPRMEYQAVPAQLARAYQATGDARVFAGYPRLLVASQSPETSMWPVLRDPRMRGRLPPALQPGLPMGWMSTAVRWMCRHHVAILLSSILPVLLLVVTGVCDLKPGARSRGSPEANPT